MTTAEHNEQLTVQLAGCSTAASGWSQRDPAKRGDYGWSPAYQDVLELRQRFDAQQAVLRDCARMLGKHRGTKTEGAALLSRIEEAADMGRL